MTNTLEDTRKEYLEMLGLINNRIEAVRAEAILNGFNDYMMNRFKMLHRCRDDIVFSILEMDKNSHMTNY